VIAVRTAHIPTITPRFLGDARMETRFAIPKDWTEESKTTNGRE
jgi:hypothetical protein